jgi:predicted  nucleic acid-binding Zn-ribbon protein
MDPITVVVSGGGVALVTLFGRIVYNYGRDRKELNGTVGRVKNIETTLAQHIEDEEQEFKEIRKDITEIKTKVGLILEDKIKHNG